MLSYQQEGQLEGFAPINLQKGEFTLGRYVICLLDKSPKQVGSQKILRLDYDKLPLGCVIRSRREGDEFEKFGGCTKSLKRYMIDKKIPKDMRDLPVIAKGSEVYAIFGTEISEKVKIDETTKTTIYLTIKFTGEKEL